ncbi:Golgin subfamily A member 5 [Frankliniella fusca]|uniref:Golgin subfamily A member 5 n=1 Tax=Frankliniella fusca TaxID=407009 RepID=A0AAE1I2E9_9NEOP|nr:Golgin subfamily A member 5 [Frankliniella fusca]
MSWLTDLAGKAENLLNKIDQNAAVVLKDTTLINEQLQDVIWKSKPTGWRHDTEEVSSSNNEMANPTPCLRSAPSGSASPTRRLSPNRSDATYLKKNDEEDLLSFLNSSGPILPVSEELRGSPSGASVPSAGSSSPINLPSGTHSRNHSQGGISSMSSSFISSGLDENLYQSGFKPVQSIESYHQDDDISQSSLSEVVAENNLLKNEIRCLNNELSLMLRRSKAAEKGKNKVIIAGQELRTLKETSIQNEQLTKQLQLLQSQLKENEATIQSLSAENKSIRHNSTASSSADSSLAKDFAASSERLKHLEKENDTLVQETNDLHLQISRLQASIADALQQNERYRLQIADITGEAEQYRARATRVLQEKEKLIASLQAVEQGEKYVNKELIFDQEVEQLREELQLLRQESASQSKLLQSVRNDLQLCELQQEENRQKAEIEIDKLQKRYQEERSRRLQAEEDCRAHLEELQSTKFELNQQCKFLKDSLETKESEVSRLKQQFRTSNDTLQNSRETEELEARVRSLATCLMQKQSALEAMIAERNSLRLNLERMEQKHQHSSAPTAQNSGTVLNLNENEYVTRQRVPTFLSENPSDTVVARKVKRAYSSLDTLGIRIGAFLRRYPLARIFVIIYMILLHLWVAVVLFSYSPEISRTSVNNPPSIDSQDSNGVH